MPVFSGKNFPGFFLGKFPGTEGEGRREGLRFSRQLDANLTPQGQLLGSQLTHSSLHELHSLVTTNT